MSRDKARDQDRFEAIRRGRLDEAGVGWHRDNDDEPRIEYLPGELVTIERDERSVGEELTRLGSSWSRRGPLRGEEEAPLIIEVSDDAFEVARQVNEARSGRGERRVAVAPNHVLSITRTKIGPGGDPWPALPDERDRPGPPLDGAAPTIGVVDTGRWDPMPVALADAGDADDLDPVDSDQPPDLVVDYPGAGHGGFIAGVASHRAAGLDIVSRRGYRPGTDLLTEDSVVAAGDDAAAAGARILNLSLGTYAGDVIFLRHAVKRWVDAGCLVVAAAGNDGWSTPFYPAAFAADPDLGVGVVAVGALEARQGDGPAVLAAVAPFSNYGDWVTAWAPGVDVVSDYPRDHRFPYGAGDLSDPFASGLAHWDGTSFAAPFVAAEIARFAVAHGYDDDVQGAWAALRATSPFVVFWPGSDADRGDAAARRFSEPPSRRR